MGSHPVNDHLVELLALADACRRAAAARITALVSYFGYARADKWHGRLLLGARDKLEPPTVREVFVTDTVRVAEKDWPQLRVISIAPLLAGALERLRAGDSLGDLY
jgi:phosphoribosylpyrophosphate synthetase